MRGVAHIWFSPYRVIRVIRVACLCKIIRFGICSWFLNALIGLKRRDAKVVTSAWADSVADTYGMCDLESDWLQLLFG
jgi:hypothetical protein